MWKQTKKCLDFELFYEFSSVFTMCGNKETFYLSAQNVKWIQKLPTFKEDNLNVWKVLSFLDCYLLKFYFAIFCYRPRLGFWISQGYGLSRNVLSWWLLHNKWRTIHSVSLSLNQSETTNKHDCQISGEINGSDMEIWNQNHT